LITAHFTWLASITAAPPNECRITIASGCIAIRFSAVSIRDSPLLVELLCPAMLIASADSRLAASSNDVRVRVEFSKNRLMTVRPRSDVSFFTGSSTRAM
jgi:hypothetical protein